ncbi:HI0074 family nucleotidyltransferase substrate-binding subunit [Candidatus Palauibacter sp.]|uniref:HI0074 family nucleotidyltransferase substrate-binding subunit n=1 Tax=Candidatus Palauibacter sp. TaxID=3101350 RepID=UPI003B02AE3C
MSNTDERRWQQRHDTFGAALTQLTDACARDRYTFLELAGLIKTFELSFELAWKVLKDLLFYEGHEVKSPRPVIRKSFEVDYIDESDCETLLDALGKRDFLAHVYLLEEARRAEALIKESYHPVLLRLHETLASVRAR